jgi:4-hydroxybenzoyl-CoA reductase subunit beta
MLRLPPFRYHRPEGLEEALRLLAELGDGGLPVAGGTDVIPNMKHRLLEPAHLVSLGRIPELRGVAVRDGELVIGAGETLATVAAHPLVAAHAPALAAAAAQVAGPQLRSAGTLGGNLCLDTRCTYYNQSHFWRQSLGYCLKKDGDTCHVTQVGRKCVAAHSADTPPVLWAMSAVMDLATEQGVRTVPVDRFFIADGINNTVRRPGELVVRVRLPLRGATFATAFRKIRPRKSIDFPVLNLAAAADLEPDRVIRGLRVVVSALGSRPKEITGLEEVAGQRLDPAVVEIIAQRAYQQCRPLTNIIVDPEWRRAMVPIHVRRLLTDVAPPVDGAAPPA